MKDWRYSSVVEHLYSMHVALGWTSQHSRKGGREGRREVG
jgi:hypothetical protein